MMVRDDREEPPMTGNRAQETSSDRRVRREAVVREHLDAENRRDIDAVLATFSHPRYELIANGRVYDGEDEVREYFRSSRATTPDQRNDHAVLHHTDDGVIVEFELLGTTEGPHGPTPWRCRMVALFLFDDTDRIVCERVYWDANTIRMQIEAGSPA